MSHTQKAAILVVSFGTSFNDTREITIGAVERAIAHAFPEYEVRRAFTSSIIKKKIFERDGLVIDNVTEAISRAIDDGITTLIVQPTHMMGGHEYNDVMAQAVEYASQFDKFVIGKPMLETDEDFDALIKTITDATAHVCDGETSVVFMGHGTDAASNGVYAKLQNMLHEKRFDNYYIGTVEAAPDIDDVIVAMEGKKYKKAVLQPLMIVAGDHANNDMAGDDDDSWASILKSHGYEVDAILRGLGEFEGIHEIYVSHVKDAIASLG